MAQHFLSLLSPKDLIEVLLGTTLGAAVTIAVTGFVNGKIFFFLPPKAKAIAATVADLVKSGQIKVDGNLTEDEFKAIASSLAKAKE